MAFIIIPDLVKKAKKLNPNAKLLYGDILSLSQQSGYCFANNEYLAKIYDFTERTISKLISELLEFGLIEIKNRTGDYGSGRAIIPLVTVENEQTFQQGREIVPRTNVLPTTNERSKKVEQSFQEGRTIEQESTNDRSTIIDNIKDKLKDKENIIVKEVSEKQVFAPTPEKVKSKVEKISYTLPDEFSKELKETFEQFMIYKKQRKESYKTEHSVNLLIKRIQTNRVLFSDTLLIDLINTTMESNWAGIPFDKLTKMKEQKQIQPEQKFQHKPIKFDVL